MDGAQKFIDWLLEAGYLEDNDILTDRDEITDDIRKIKKVAPKFYNMMMCMSDCEERAGNNSYDAHEFGGAQDE